MQDIKVLGKVSPTCEGIHDINKEYTRLSIVTNADKTKSYISKKDVPANIELTNDEYWQIFTSVDFYTDITESEIIELINTKVDERMSMIVREMTNMENRINELEKAIENGTGGTSSNLTVELINMNLPQPLNL